MYWPNEKKHFSGTIDQCENKSKKHTINCDEVDVEILDFIKEKRRRIPNSTNFTALSGELRELFVKPPNEVCEIVVRDTLDPRFVESSLNEIKGLLERGTSIAARKEKIPNRATILKSRVHHSIKTNPGGIDNLKKRLAIQGIKDPYKETGVKEVPTINMSRDVRQAFVQSDSPLCRDLHIKPPVKPGVMSMINQPRDGFLHALKPVYGLTESPGYW